MAFGLFKRKKGDTRAPPPTDIPYLSASDEEVVRAANAAIDAYDLNLESYPIGFDTRGTSRLPRPKSELIIAIQVALSSRGTKASVNSFLRLV